MAGASQNAHEQVLMSHNSTEGKHTCIIQREENNNMV
jgi:hypothetical protein